MLKVIMLANIRTIFAYRDYIFYKSWADLRAEARRFYISYLWWILSPILEMLLYYLIFGLGLKGFKTENFVVFLIIGVITWKWFQTASQHCRKSIQKHHNLLQQVYLPKIIFPLIDICTDTFKFFIAFIIFILIINISGMYISTAYLTLPLVLLTQLLLIMSVGILFAALTPFFPDFELFSDYLIRLLFFMSGVFFDVRQISEKYSFVFNWNPMVRIIGAYRDILMRGQAPEIFPLVVISIGSIFTILVLMTYIFKIDKIYPKLSG